MKRTCSVQDCDRPSRARGWCIKHYQRWRSHGDTSVVKVRMPARDPKPKSPCAIAGCGGLAEIRGWCKTHYARWHRTGDPVKPDRRFKEKAPCVVASCDDNPISYGFCNRHYQRIRRWGIPSARTPIVRFFERVVPGDGGCWNFTSLRDDGYGRFGVDYQSVPSHRWSYEFFRAEIPEGLVLDHLCENRACVNPWHLDPVPPLINLIRTYRRDPKDRVPT